MKAGCNVSIFRPALNPCLKLEHELGCRDQPVLIVINEMTNDYDK